MLPMQKHEMSGEELVLRIMVLCEHVMQTPESKQRIEDYNLYVEAFNKKPENVTHKLSPVHPEKEDSLFFSNKSEWADVATRVRNNAIKILMAHQEKIGVTYKTPNGEITVAADFDLKQTLVLMLDREVVQMNRSTKGRRSVTGKSLQQLAYDATIDETNPPQQEDPNYLEKPEWGNKVSFHTEAFFQFLFNGEVEAYVKDQYEAEKAKKKPPEIPQRMDFEELGQALEKVAAERKSKEKQLKQMDTDEYSNAATPNEILADQQLIDEEAVRRKEQQIAVARERLQQAGEAIQATNGQIHPHRLNRFKAHTPSKRNLSASAPEGEVEPARLEFQNYLQQLRVQLTAYAQEIQRVQQEQLDPILNERTENIPNREIYEDFYAIRRALAGENKAIDKSKVKIPDSFPIKDQDAYITSLRRKYVKSLDELGDHLVNLFECSGLKYAENTMHDAQIKYSALKDLINYGYLFLGIDEEHQLDLTKIPVPVDYQLQPVQLQQFYIDGATYSEVPWQSQDGSSIIRANDQIQLSREIEAFLQQLRNEYEAENNDALYSVLADRFHAIVQKYKLNMLVDEHVKEFLAKYKALVETEENQAEREAAEREYARLREQYQRQLAEESAAKAALLVLEEELRVLKGEELAYVDLNDLNLDAPEGENEKTHELELQQVKAMRAHVAALLIARQVIAEMHKALEAGLDKKQDRLPKEFGAFRPLSQAETIHAKLGLLLTMSLFAMGEKMRKPVRVNPARDDRVAAQSVISFALLLFDKWSSKDSKEKYAGNKQSFGGNLLTKRDVKKVKPYLQLMGEVAQVIEGYDPREEVAAPKVEARNKGGLISRMYPKNW